MTNRKTTTVVPYSARQMYALVADVERYPEFIPWCTALRVLERRSEGAQTRLLADMVVAYKVFRERFRSRVVCDDTSLSIDVDYVDGPFRKLVNKWRFSDIAGGGSSIDFEIDFEFRNFVLQTTARTVFDKAFSRMTDAFVERAHDLYGAQS